MEQMGKENYLYEKNNIIKLEKGHKRIPLARRLSPFFDGESCCIPLQQDEEKTRDRPTTLFRRRITASG